MKCLICIKYEKDIRAVKGQFKFKDEWIKGSKNYRLDNATDHALSAQHQRCMKLYYTDEKGNGYNNEREKGQSSILDQFASMEQKDIEQTRRKIETAYFVAKEELPLAKYVSILALEERHNVTFGSAYRNSNACGDFIDCIGDELMNNLKGFLEKAKFYSILFDGTTDKSAAEKESFFVLYLDKDTDAEKVEVKLSFLGLSDIHHAHAVGVKQSIDDVFVHVGLDDYRNQLVGLGADGASLM